VPLLARPAVHISRTLLDKPAVAPGDPKEEVWEARHGKIQEHVSGIAFSLYKGANIGDGVFVPLSYTSSLGRDDRFLCRDGLFL
jgi:hypothetical protein